MDRLGLIALTVAFLSCSCCGADKVREARKTFDGQSKELKHTQIVASLDAMLEKDKNTIWCASFLSAWKSLQNDLAGESVQLKDNPPTVTGLNTASDPRKTIPDGTLYVATGFVDKGIIGRIKKDLKKKFPAKTPPTFPTAREDSFVAYAYMQANVKFTIPYFQSRKPLAFKEGDGAKVKVQTFGIREDDDYAYYKLRKQARILYQDIEDKKPSELEFVIDLCADSSPSQVIVARVKRKATLKDTIAVLEEKCDKYLKKTAGFKSMQELGPRDVLLVPDICFKLIHRFRELERQPFKNDKLAGQYLDRAQQDIFFKLARGGAELKSEAKMICEPVPTYFLLDQPFLIIMRKRGEMEPYFVMWVDNAELLNKWKQKRPGIINSSVGQGSIQHNRDELH